MFLRWCTHMYSLYGHFPGKHGFNTYHLGYLLYFYFQLLTHSLTLLSVLQHYWLGVRKSIRPVKNWGMRYKRSYLSEVRCKLFAYGQVNATVSSKSWLVERCRFTQVFLKKRPLNGCLSVCLFIPYLFKSSAPPCISADRPNISCPH